MTGQGKTENALYAGLWVIFFASPLLTELIETKTEPYSVYDWYAVGHSYILLATLCAVFYLHNFLLAPILVYKSRPWLYAGLMAALLCCFQLLQCNNPLHDPGKMRRHKMEMRQGDPSAQEPAPMAQDGNPMAQDGGPMMHESNPQLKGSPPPKPDGRHDPGRPGKRGPLDFNEKDLMVLWVLILLLGANVGFKYYFKMATERKRLKDTQQQMLQQQLAYLKHQINPHFFMNTLNNIHALVSIDPALAEKTIETLSKLMRYVLYECDRPWVTMEKEVQFSRNYIEVMRLRLTDGFDLRVDFPAELPDAEVPPLVLLPFIENAFKHGVSYEQHSYIHVQLVATDEEAIFHCRNSRKRAESDERGGVGLENIRKKLDLIFPGRHSLDIHTTEKDFSVTLTFPLHHSVNPTTDD